MELIIAIIASIAPITTVIVGAMQSRASSRRTARYTIISLIVVDHVRVLEGTLPENYQAIHEEFDLYLKSGGNSYIEEKVRNYDKWHHQLLATKKKGDKDAKN